MKTNKTPTIREALIRLATQAASAAHNIGSAVGLLQNTGEKIDTDLHAYIGPPGSSGVTGSIAEFNDALAGTGAARGELRNAVSQGREFCAKAMGLLKNSLGAAGTRTGAQPGSLAARSPCRKIRSHC